MPPDNSKATALNSRVASLWQTSLIMTHNSGKTTVMKEQQIIYGWGHHSMRKCIKGLQR